MPQDKHKPNGIAKMFSRMESRQDALDVTRDSAKGFFVLSVIQTLGGIFLIPSMLFDAVIFAALAGMLIAWKSRIVAVILLLMALLVVVTTTLTKLGIAKVGGSNIFLALIILWAAVRAVHATFLLHGRFSEAKDEGVNDMA